MILGDDGEWDPGRADTNLAGGVPIRFDPAARTLLVHTSIVGLPPIFLYRGERCLALGSDIHLLRGLPGVRLDFDPVAVSELARIGHPVAHRTLFRNLEMVPAGGRLSMGLDGNAEFRRVWELPELSPLTWPQFIEAQIAAFTEAVRRIRVKDSFLSLTAGLDTRTVFAALAQQQRLVPAATMTGVRRSLDARIAGRLCRAYDVRHHLITFDDRFVRELPRFLETASRLSGGLASLGQAPEVYFYDQLGAGFTARLSGNLGNQVGRGGTEGVSTRGADESILDPRIRSAGAAQPGAGHWLLEKLNQDQRTTLQFILQNETVFTLVSNFPIGNHFAMQQTPYANRALIETLAQRPTMGAEAPSGSMWRMRLRDLNHRFFGEPEAFSFQRMLVKRIGGAAASTPINWGWRPAGGVSLPALMMGTATLFGMYARARGLDGGILRLPLALTGLPALHDFRETRRWLRQDLRDYTRDTLGTVSVREAGLFDSTRLTRILDEHFEGGRDHYETVTLALDLCLAHRVFG